MDEKKLTFSGHLADLRRALLISAVAMIVGFGVAVSFWEYLHTAMMWPIQDLLPPGSEPVYLGVFEPIFYMLKLGLTGGILLASPIVFWQVWWFVAPGLTAKERRYALPFILAASFFFLGGAAFCYFIVLPNAVAFSISLMGASAKMELVLNQYLSNAAMFMLAFGVIFETPVMVFLVSTLGLVHPKTLAKYRKYVLLACFIIGAVLTPTPDAFNQSIMAVPMYILYELGVLVARIVVRRKEKEREKEGYET
ncbi:MAG: twin-arginine translocase subunit TatC [Anaerolineae bacterium]